MDALIVLAMLVPLLLAVLQWPPTLRMLAGRLAVLAPLPALMLALAAPVGADLDLPGLLLGSRYALDETGRLFLGFTAGVWLLAGLYARGYLARDPRQHVFGFFFLATQAGNLGLILAADAASFYLMFALMSFAAYGLVVHTGDAEARRAGRVYMIMALLGEAALVTGMMQAAHATDSLLLADWAAAPLPAPTVALLLAGFGVKAGMPLLHMWLPLAHPVAPAPASAVLSGVIIKAGLLGWLRVLPLGEASLPGGGGVLMAAGLAAIPLAVVAGLGQRDPKAVLAYSSIGQMGALSLGVGAGLAQPSLWPLLSPALGLYALHHALSKSALFLGVGVIGRHGARPIWLAALALPALALAGAPLTSGFTAKGGLKAALTALEVPWVGALPWFLSLASAGSALLMARLFWLLTRPAAAAYSGASGGLLAPWGLALLAVAAAGLWPGPQDWDAFISALWPLTLAAGLAWLALRRRLRAPCIPPGDLLALGKIFRGHRPLAGPD